MHIKHHPTSPPTPFIPQWTILTVLFNTQLNLMANSYSMRISFQISSLGRSKELSPQPRMAVAKVLLRGWKETRRSRDESKVKPRRETGLEGRYPEYLTTYVPGRSSESNKKPTKIYTYIYMYLPIGSQEGFAGRRLASRRVINIKAGTSFHHYRRHLSWYKYGYNRYAIIRVKSRILTGLTFYSLFSTMNTKFYSILFEID